MIISAALLNIGIYFLFAALLVISMLLLLVILMQRPKQEGLGATFGSALTDQAFGARTTDVLKKATIYLGSLFMITVFVLAILTNKKYSQQAAENALISEQNTEEQAQKTSAQQKEEVSPLEQLKKAEQSAESSSEQTPETPVQEETEKQPEPEAPQE